ncbi:MAG: hypothetical protein KA187_01205 [Arenimonas sp.]|nr:hypothetical protein [Arenimonas sp.]MBP6626010.1 hypothetical protein [Arenimonas sp.]
MTTLADFYRLFPSHAAVAAPVRQALPSVATERRLDPAQARPAPRYRERSVGTGYGRSSGYGKLGAYASAPAALVRVC